MCEVVVSLILARRTEEGGRNVKNHVITYHFLAYILSHNCGLYARALNL